MKGVKVAVKLKVIARKAKKSATSRVIRRPKLKTSARKANKDPLSKRQREDLVVNTRDQARKLARSILRKWHSRLDIEEVDSIVDLSLCEAVRRYNPKFGASFITFLYYHMRGNLIRAVHEAANLNMIAIPDDELEQHANDSQLTGYNDKRGVTAGEIADALTSQEMPLPDEHLFRKELADLSNDACRKLDSLEREVVSQIYLQEEQLVSVAENLGYSRCHISRVKRKALETLYKELAISLDFAQKTRPGDIADGEEGESSTPRRVMPRRLRRASEAKEAEQTEEQTALAA